MTVIYDVFIKEFGDRDLTLYERFLDVEAADQYVQKLCGERPIIEWRIQCNRQFEENGKTFVETTITAHATTPYSQRQTDAGGGRAGLTSYIALLEDWVNDFVRLTDIMRDCPQYEALYVAICNKVTEKRLEQGRGIGRKPMMDFELHRSNAQLYKENEALKMSVEALASENARLRGMIDTLLDEGKPYYDDGGELERVNFPLIGNGYPNLPASSQDVLDMLSDIYAQLRPDGHLS